MPNITRSILQPITKKIPAKFGGSAIIGGVSAPSLRYLAAEGDSLTAGTNTGGTSFITIYSTDASPALTSYYISAVGGSQVSGMVSRAAALDATLGDAWNFLSVMIGTNDFSSGANRPVFLADLAAYLDARRAAGWIVILNTIPPRNNAAFNIERNIVNGYLRSWVGVHCDEIVNHDATLIGQDATAADLTYFQVDGTHPTVAGQTLLEVNFKAVLDAMPIVNAPALLAAGTYTGSQVTKITSTTSGATIYYTTDGSTPTTSSTLYTAPVMITASQTIKAIATKQFYTASSVASAAYTISAGNGGILAATGGTIETVGDFKVHTFTSNANFVITSGTGHVEYLIGAGGGGGGSFAGGGGGGGGVKTGSVSMTSGTFPVVVGGGGAGAVGNAGPGANGGNSTFNGLTATGGGGGAGGNGSAAAAGGSGGGGAYASAAGGAGTGGQGNNGGTGGGATYYAAGGGGGTATVGVNSTTGQLGGKGGDALAYGITGAMEYLGAGGGGSGSVLPSAMGGLGGTGNANYTNPSAAFSGTANKADGGGGAFNGAAGSGGSGVVKLRYKYQ